MNIQFGNKDLPYTIRIPLQDAKQNIDETVEEFADKGLLQTVMELIPQKKL